MKPTFSFLVKPLNGKRYSNTKNIAGVEFITSVSQEDHTATQRYAEVVEVPMGYSGDVKIGDTIIVHHNIFRKYYGMNGNEKSGFGHIIDDLFLVDLDQAYLHSHKDSEWYSIDDFVFVKPIESTLSLSIDIYEQNQGIVTFTNKKLFSQGITAGTRVIFTPYSEYKFVIGEDTLYRMRTKDIAVKL